MAARPKRWGQTIRHFLKDDGFSMSMMHIRFTWPWMKKTERRPHRIKYPYFQQEPDEDSTIGGYACEAKEATNYFWMYTMSGLINSLSEAGLFIEYLHEYDRCVPGMGGTTPDGEGLLFYPSLEKALPLTFSLKAIPR